jgi:hypothetical protein
MITNISKWKTGILFLSIMIISLIFNSKTAVGCEVYKATGVSVVPEKPFCCWLALCTDKYLTNILIPKPSQNSETIIFGDPSYIDYYAENKDYITEGVCVFDAIESLPLYGYRTAFVVGKEPFSVTLIGIAHKIGNYFDVYSGPNCELLHSKLFHEISGYYLGWPVNLKIGDKYVLVNCESDKPIVKNAYLTSVYFDSFEDFSEYNGMCSYFCGGDKGCMGVYPNSIGVQSVTTGSCGNRCEYFTQIPVLCNEMCKMEKVDWSKVLSIEYTINGVTFRVDGNRIEYYANPEETLNIKVKVSVSNEYKNKFIPRSERVIVAISHDIRGLFEDRMYAQEYYEGKFDDEISFNVKASNYPTYIYPTINKYSTRIRFYDIWEQAFSKISSRPKDRSWITSYVKMPFLVILPNNLKSCSKIIINGKNFVVMANSSLKEDPDGSLWDKCCTLKAIDISTEKQDINTKDSGGLILKLKIKDNRPAYCEELFGNLTLSFYEDAISSLNQLKVGENSFWLRTTIYPKIDIKPVCGNDICEYGLGEEYFSCPKDCKSYPNFP